MYTWCNDCICMFCVDSLLYDCLLADYCALPRDEGNCTERHPRWFFDSEENRCMPFYYSGCGGNDNKFDTEQACEADCPSKFGKFSLQHLPAVNTINFTHNKMIF